MLLAPILLLGVGSCCRLMLQLAASLLLLLTAAPDVALALPACVLEVPVYDASGNRLEFRVTRVVPEGNDKIDLLSLKRNDVRVTSRGDRVSFSDESLLGRVVQITLENGSGAVLTQKVLLMQCQQRASTRFGESETWGDVRYITLRGRVSGCRFAGDWWVRAMPMFGAASESQAFEGYIEPDGWFALSGQMRGERHIVVFGKGVHPVKAVGVNTIVGGKNDLGVVDFSGQCPQ